MPSLTCPQNAGPGEPLATGGPGMSAAGGAAEPGGAGDFGSAEERTPGGASAVVAAGRPWWQLFQEKNGQMDGGWMWLAWFHAG